MQTATFALQALRPVTGITLRLASPEDRQPLRAMHHLALRTLALGDYTERQIESCIDNGRTMDDYLITDGTYYVAEAGGALAGSGGWTMRVPGYTAALRTSADEKAGRRSSHVPVIRSMFVHPAWVRRGIGSAVLLACESAILMAGYPVVELDALLSGVPLYLSAGYVPAGRAALTFSDGEQMPIVRMRKTLLPITAQDVGR